MLYIQLTVHYSCAISHKFCRVTQIEIVFQRKPFLNEMNICNDVLIVINSKLSRCWIVRLYESGWIKFTFIVKLLVSNSWMMPANNYGEPYMLEVGSGNSFGHYHPLSYNITHCYILSPWKVTFHHMEGTLFIANVSQSFISIYFTWKCTIIWSNIENRFQN